MSVGLSISPGNMSVYDTGGSLKFSSERVYPTVLWTGQINRGVTGVWLPISRQRNNDSHVYTHGGFRTNVDEIILRRGTHYQGHPEFVTANVIGNSPTTNISNTITGSYIATTVSGPSRGARHGRTNAAQEEWMRVGPIVLIAYHLWVNSNGDVVWTTERVASDYVTCANNIRPKVFAATNLMRNQTIFLYNINSNFEMRQVFCNFPRINITVGRFTG